MPEKPCTVLLVDDDCASREAMTEWLRSEGFGVVPVANGDEAIGHLHDGVAVIVTDLKMPRTDGPNGRLETWVARSTSSRKQAAEQSSIFYCPVLGGTKQRCPTRKAAT